MSNKPEIVTFRGKTSFAKIIGEPTVNRFDGNKEWTMDLVVDKEHVKKAKALGISDKIKMKPDYLDGQPYMSFKQKELRPNGDKNDPIRVVDIRGNAWDDRLIGNGSDVDVKFAIVKNPGKRTGTYLRGVRVLSLVSYERKEFDVIDENDPFFAKLKEEADESTPAVGGFDSSDDEEDDLPF